ncbi:MAG: alkaline phosphatase family protein [Verrucomicrobia bacterium]|nr:alkaline phosphatase family protein [Verrucomicrobiota bacterium]
MKPVLPLFIMLDACGWEIVKNDPFLNDHAPTRKKLSSVFGYSSTCVPSILSGRWPDEHHNWCYFVYDPKRSPFKFLSPFRWLPTALTSRRIFRRYLTKLIRKKLGFEGYFDLYNIPFEHIALYDFSEKKSPLKPNGMNQGLNIFDFLVKNRINYFGSDPDKTEVENRDDLITAIEGEKIDFSFSYWPGLDGLLHNVGNQSPEVPKRLRMYEEWLEKVMEAAREHYEEVRLYVFSDHGMANCDEHLDLKTQIEALDVKMGDDYAVVYDSTMARFWFFNERARAQISDRLKQVPEGRILPDNELKDLRAYFPDGKFGELIFLVKEGVLIVPSHMGERPIRAMHGYHPLDKHSYATLLTNQAQIPDDVVAIPDIFKLMKCDAQLAKAENTAVKANLYVT